MAHQDTYWSDADQAKTIGEWQASYPALRYMYATVKKTTTTYYHQESSGDSWTGIKEWHWSYWGVLDWVYPNDEGWTNEQKTSLSNTLRRSDGSGAIEGDTSQPLREQILTYGGNSNTTLVSIAEPYAIRNENTYYFFETYNYDPSELSGDEIGKIDEYTWSASIINDRGDLWSLNNSGRLILDDIHSEVLPDEENPPATQWYLNESGRLRMPLMKELVNDLGGFNNNPNLEKVVIPSSVMSIGRLSFNNTNLTEVTLSDECTYYGSSFPPGCNVIGGQLIN